MGWRRKEDPSTISPHIPQPEQVIPTGVTELQAAPAVGQVVAVGSVPTVTAKLVAHATSHVALPLQAVPSFAKGVEGSPVQAAGGQVMECKHEEHGLCI